MVEELNFFFYYMGKVTNMVGDWARVTQKLVNQITINSTMVGQVVSMVYAHKMSLDVGMYATTILQVHVSIYLYICM